MNKRRVFRSVACILAVGSFCYFLICGKGGLLNSYRLRCENQKLQCKIEHLEQQKDSFSQEIIAYQDGDFAREKLAREELLMGRGEIVYLD